MPLLRHISSAQNLNNIALQEAQPKKDLRNKPDDDRLGSAFSSDSDYGKHSVATSYIQRNMTANNLAAKAMELTG